LLCIVMTSPSSHYKPLSLHDARPIWVVLGEARLTVRELLSLEPGDVLQLEQRVDQPLAVHVGDRPFFLGSPGEASGRLAVRLDAAWPGAEPLAQEALRREEEADGW